LNLDVKSPEIPLRADCSIIANAIIWLRCMMGECRAYLGKSSQCIKPDQPIIVLSWDFFENKLFNPRRWTLPAIQECADRGIWPWTRDADLLSQGPRTVG